MIRTRLTISYYPSAQLVFGSFGFRKTIAGAEMGTMIFNDFGLSITNSKYPKTVA